MAKESFTLRPRNVELIKAELKKQYGNMQSPSSNATTMEGIYLFPDKEGRIDVYKSGTVMFTNMSEDYYKFRMLDMKQDNERVEKANVNSPTLSSLNFEHAIIGSDETGKGEVFKPFIITAVYIKDEDELFEYLKMGVTDSKKVKGKIPVIGKQITGIDSWEEIKDKRLFGNDRFVTRIVMNEEYNDCCRERGGQAKDVQKELLAEAHMEVLRELHKKHPEGTVVVDDFFDGKGGVPIFKNTLSKGESAIPAEKVFFTTQGDMKVMAIGVASIISYYFSTLGLTYVEKQLNEVYKRDEISEVKLPKGSGDAEETAEFISKLKPELKNEFMNKYAKCYFGNVQEALKR